MKDRIKELLNALNNDVFEKEEVIRLALLSAIAGESIFLLGAPGVAKSLIARRIKFAFNDSKSFEYLMNRFSTPDEIFGPISISKLKNDDKYERLIEGYLPDSNVIFLDEIWKAGPSIQNALLTVLNEKLYRNGANEVRLNVLALLSASNELPAKEQDLEALWDRFLIRYVVEGVLDKNNFNKLISENLSSYEDNIEKSLKITQEEYKDWSNEINEITIPNEVFNLVHVVRKEIENYNKNENNKDKLYISDRRWRKIIRLLRTSAFLNERDSVDLMDCYLITHCIWNEPDQINDTNDIVVRSLKNHGYSLNLNLGPIKQSISNLRDEIKESTEHITSEEIEEFTVFDKKYYIVKNLIINTSYNRIKISDYNDITESQSTVSLYDNTGSSVSYPMHLSGDDLNIHQNGSWITCSLEKYKELKDKITIKKPVQRLIDAWDNVTGEIMESIQKEIDTIQNYMTKDLKNLKTNIFVDPSLSVHIESNLNLSKDSIESYKIDVAKIKDQYGNIE